MATHQGLDVLEIDGDGRFERADAHDRAIVVLDAGHGRKDADDIEGVSGVHRDYLWTGLGLSDVAALKAFIDARKGRAVPFWLATLEHDVTLNGDHNAAHAFIDIVSIGYTENLFPYSGARRHLFFRSLATGAAFYRKVTSSVNNLNGTESLYLDSALGVSVPVADYMVGFLRLCRLEEDEVTISWSARSHQAARIRLHELPLEAPL